MRSFKSNENIHKKEGGSYYVVSANKASSVTLQSPGNESQRKHTAILRISNKSFDTFVAGQLECKLFYIFTHYTPLYRYHISEKSFLL